MEQLQNGELLGDSKYYGEAVGRGEGGNASPSPPEDGDGAMAAAAVMEKKSDILDEVNQLMELMATEKSQLQEKISLLETAFQESVEKGVDLEGKLASESSSVSRQRQRCAEMEARALAQSKELLELNSKKLLLESANQLLQANHKCVQEELQQAKRELRETREALDSQTATWKEDAAAIETQWKERLEKMERKYQKANTALKVQCSEDIKLKSQLSKAAASCQCMEAEKAHLRTQVDGWQLRARQRQDEVLALKGRLTSLQKAHEKLQGRCMELEKTDAINKSPKVVGTHTHSARSKEEVRLSAECKRKEELLSKYGDEMLCIQQAEIKLKQQNDQLHKSLTMKEKESSEKRMSLEESVCQQQKLHQQLEECRSQLRLHEQNERAAVLLSRDFERRLKQFEKELKTSRENMATIGGLQRQLEMEGEDRAGALGRAEDRWRAECGELQLKYDRLQEASSRRCAELAREVWELRALTKHAS